MSITRAEEWVGLQAISDVVGETLRQMREYAQPGMRAKELDEFGGALLARAGARSAPKVTYGFPGYTCISVNQEVAHGIPSANKILQEGDLVNIDVSAELDGYWADNGGSFVLGRDLHGHQSLVNASKLILQETIAEIRSGVRIAEIGGYMERRAKALGFTVIRNLTGHGIGRSLHEAPREIANYYDRYNRAKFQRNSVIALETFISTRSTMADTQKDGWTLVGNKGGYVAQHEHTLVVTDGEPVILTHSNQIY
ncbi:type I methionyl aminopeptidase [Flavihumibacter fluvii]|uniref:type I methionyl aminopeptidase n=1 Tax=Flavihumibacter fluvii TaxID=2838157 RepID=UPI001BDE83BE|nr:type I methionyl aminopeptidase [Flavihumibacter fluvii]ULQ50986.1 type I methionyl aminopeptidase [Flavihumibacter fluvii]